MDINFRPLIWFGVALGAGGAGVAVLVYWLVTR